MKRAMQKRVQRHKRVRAKVFGTKDRPRFSVYRSNKHLFLQLVDDERCKTVLGVSDKKIKAKKGWKKSDVAYELGKLLAKLTQEKKITKAVFDRGGYKYHGRVKKAAEGAREGGLQF